MDDTIVYEQGYEKPGTSRFSNNLFAINLSEASGPVQIQVKRLISEFGKYSDLSFGVRSRLENEMLKINDIRYMNMQYLAAALDILEKMNIRGEEFDDYMIKVLNDDKLFNIYYKNLFDPKKENVIPNYKTKMKKVLFTYCFKIYNIRNQK